MAKKIVIVDLDGTLSTPDPERMKHVSGSENIDLDAFYAHSFDDEPIASTVALVKHLHRVYTVVYCTARSERARVKTLNWFDKHSIPYQNKNLLMRPEGDERNSCIVKQYLIFKKAGIRPNQIAFMLDDHNKVVHEFRALGITVLQPANNDF